MVKATPEMLKTLGIRIDDPVENLITLLGQVAVLETAYDEKRGGVIPEIVSRGITRRVRKAHLEIPDGERHFKIWENVRAEEDRLGRELTDAELNALGASRVE